MALKMTFNKSKQEKSLAEERIDGESEEPNKNDSSSDNSLRILHQA